MAHRLLEAIDDNIHPTVTIPNGLFLCEKCKKQHIGFSVDQEEFQYLRNLVKRQREGKRYGQYAVYGGYNRYHGRETFY
jgi:hypothetical protein